MMRWTNAVLAALLAVCAAVSQAEGVYVDGANTWLAHTHLLELQQGSRLSDKASSLGNGGYELSDGTYRSFHVWYATRWTDVRVSWLTQVTNNFGLIWGVSTGERGAKYAISPSMKLGFLAQAAPTKNTLVVLRATAILGGRLREKSCVADYGDIGGVQEVNCRLAASQLQPEETLTYLVREKPENPVQVAISFAWRF